MKVIMYGIDSCSNCIEAKKIFEENNINYKYLSFSDSIMNLRRFLEFRDKEPMFDAMRAEGRVGLPLLQLEDGTLTFSVEDVLKKAKESC